MRKAAPLGLLAVLGAGLAFAGCGGGTTTVITTVVPGGTATTQTSADEGAILDAAVAFYKATGDDTFDRSQLKLVKTNGQFADVLVAQEAHVILKKGGDTWVVVWDGNGTMPPETRSRFGVPPDYGG